MLLPFVFFSGFNCFLPILIVTTFHHQSLRLFLIQVNLLKSKFGFDEAFNYKKEQDLVAALRRLASSSFVHCTLELQHRQTGD